ncbi:hypothetical protein DENSPDRAFT_59415 [Dentipellis sp. KUC8613]|nr:hypothetical protein DENSPDRAFT_59415 [Dentipellis sp. KUC8613]
MAFSPEHVLLTVALPPQIGTAARTRARACQQNSSTPHQACAIRVVVAPPTARQRQRQRQRIRLQVAVPPRWEHGNQPTLSHARTHIPILQT